MSYGIVFDLPEHDDPVFAGLRSDGKVGFANSINTALRFTSETDAQHTLEASYGILTRPFGTVVEFEK